MEKMAGKSAYDYSDALMHSFFLFSLSSCALERKEKKKKSCYIVRDNCVTMSYPSIVNVGKVLRNFVSFW